MKKLSYLYRTADLGDYHKNHIHFSTNFILYTLESEVKINHSPDIEMEICLLKKLLLFPKSYSRHLLIRTYAQQLILQPLKPPF